MTSDAIENGRSHHNHDHASDALLHGPAKQDQGSLSHLVGYLKQDVDETWGDAVLIWCNAISGLMDSAAYNTWGCFASMQTSACGLSLSHFDPFKVGK